MARRTISVVVAVTLSGVAALVTSTPAAGQDEAPADPVSWQSAGDSYSSGEGVFGNAGECAQSDNAYGPLTAWLLRGSGWNITSETFTACTGHLVEDYFTGRNAGDDSLWQWGRDQEGPERVDVIAMSFGGNDIGFADVIKDCLVGTPGSWHGVITNPVGTATGCRTPGDELIRRVDALLDPTRQCDGMRHNGSAGYDCDLNIGARRGSIIDFYYDVVTDRLTDRGRLYVVGYPAVFAPQDQWPRWSQLTCARVTRHDAEKLSIAAGHLNSKLIEAVDRANQALGSERVVFVDRHELYRSGNHELCGTGDDWLNGLSATRGYGFSYRLATSFHPNLDGHTATAQLLYHTVRETFPTTTTTTVPTAPPPTQFPWADDWTQTPQLGTEPAAGSGCGWDTDYGATLPDGWWYGVVDSWDNTTGEGTFILVCGLLGEAAQTSFQECLAENPGEDWYCDNYFHPDFSLYPVGSPHAPVGLSAAPEVTHETDLVFGICDPPNDIAGFSGMSRWIHTTGGAIDYVFHICPFG